jgi:BirA family transcriptional regulator, biotin operon repressor / biotin---[acetyl-CoA-carboxylase] ligase
MKQDAGIFSPEAISRDLDVTIIGRRIQYFPVLASTMDAARDFARNSALEGTVIIADTQTAGRGRLARSWHTPQGNIALSIVLYPRLSQLTEMIMLASLGVVHSIEAVTGIKVGIKWPNDVLINGKKVCGILIESDARTQPDERVAYVIIGIGINVNLKPADFSDIAATATSLSLAAGGKVSRLAVVRSLLVETDRLYAKLNNGESLFEEWQERLVTLGQMVKVTAIDAVYEGRAESVERDGSLLVRDANGELRRVVAGDVTLKTT